MSFRRVYLEIPYADVARSVAFARACVADCLRRGEAVVVPRLLYAQGGAVRAFLEVCDTFVVYLDLGVTEDMRRGKEEAERLGIPVERRMLALAADWQIDYYASYDLSLTLSDRERRDLIAALDDSVDSAAGIPYRSEIAARWRALRERLEMCP